MSAMTMRVLDLFSGIGGFSLGLERAGMKTVAFCEIEPYCQAVLRKHWPDVPCYQDVRELTSARLRADGISVDVICGGFPCQDISMVRRGDGLAGKRSGLWYEFARLIRELRPRYVIVENVAALVNRGLGEILGELAEIGYSSQWDCVPAAYVGAPHVRDRLWLVAYPSRDGRNAWGKWSEQPGPFPFSGGQASDRRNAWPAEPDLVRMVHGVPSRVDRVAALGNAVVPQIPEMIGRAIMASIA